MRAKALWARGAHCRQKEEECRHLWSLGDRLRGRCIVRGSGNFRGREWVMLAMSMGTIFCFQLPPYLAISLSPSPLLSFSPLPLSGTMKWATLPHHILSAVMLCLTHHRHRNNRTKRLYTENPKTVSQHVVSSLRWFCQLFYQMMGKLTQKPKWCGLDGFVQSTGSPFIKGIKTEKASIFMFGSVKYEIPTGRPWGSQQFACSLFSLFKDETEARGMNYQKMVYKSMKSRWEYLRREYRSTTGKKRWSTGGTQPWDWVLGGAKVL